MPDVTPKLTEAQARFLAALEMWDGIADPRTISAYPGVRITSGVRSACKRAGYVTFDGRHGYWRITPAGRLALEQEGQPS